MTTVTATRPKVHPPAACVAVLTQAPVYPCDIIPDGLPGTCTINGRPYAVEANVSGRGRTGYYVEGWVFTSAEGRRYDVEAGSLLCDCADATYRPRSGPCKHARAVVQMRLLMGEV